MTATHPAVDVHHHVIIPRPGRRPHLRGIEHVTAHGASGYHVTHTRHDGQAPATPPARAVPWTVQAGVALGVGAALLIVRPVRRVRARP